MIRTCNNCDINFCKPGNKHYCSNHRNIISKVPLRMLISKVTIKNTEEANPVLHLFKAWM